MGLPPSNENISFVPPSTGNENVNSRNKKPKGEKPLKNNKKNKPIHKPTQPKPEIEKDLPLPKNNTKTKKQPEDKNSNETNKTEPKKVKEYRSLYDWATDVVVELPSDVPKTVYETCKQLKIQFVLKSSPAYKKHALSALYRDLAFRYIMSLTKHNYSTCDFYGSSRNFNIIKSIPANIRPHWTVSEPRVIEGSSARGFRSVHDWNAVYDHILIQDVYMDGSEPLSWNIIDKLLSQLSPQGALWITARRFIGEAGADDAAWTRRSDGKILFYPEYGAQSYQAHWDLEWLFETVHPGVSFMECSTVGPYFVVKLTPTDKHAFPIGKGMSPAPIFDKIQFRYSNLEESLKVPFLKTVAKHYDRVVNRIHDYIWKSEDLTVHMPTIASLAPSLVTSTFQGPSYDRTTSQVLNKMGADPACQMLQRVFPIWYSQMVNDTVLYASFVLKQRSVPILSRLRDLYHHEDQNLALLRSASHVKSPTSYGPLLVGLAMITAAIFGYKIHSTYIPKLHDMFFPTAEQSIPPTNTETCSVPVSTHETDLPIKIEHVVKLENAVSLTAPIVPFCHYVLEGVQSASFPQIRALVATFLKRILRQFRWKQMQVFPNLGLFSPLVEELIKFHIPVSTMFIALYETLQDPQQWYRPIFHLLTFYYYSLGYNIVIPFIIHSLWNWMGAKPYKPKYTIEQFQLDYENLRQDIGFELTVVQPKGDTVLPAITCRTSVPHGPNGLRGVHSFRLGPQTFTPSDLAKVLSSQEYPAQKGVFVILGTSALMYAPARNEMNYFVMLTQRYLHLPWKVRDPEIEQEQKYYLSTFHGLIYEIFHQTSLDYTPIDDVITKSTRPTVYRIEYLKYLQNTALDGFKIELKANETIAASTLYDVSYNIKPRAIVNMNPAYHVLLGTLADALTNYFKNLFDGSPRIHHFYEFKKEKTFSFRGVYAPGASSDQIGEWFTAMQHSNNFVMASGDDSVAKCSYITDEGVKNVYIEADMTKFDHTQNENHWAVMLKILTIIGLPNDYIYLLERIIHSNFTCRYKDFVVKGNAEVQMPTGLRYTTLINTLATLHLFITWFSCRDKTVDPAISLSDHAVKCGLLLKVKVHDDLENLTFLRGWPVRVPGGNHYTWRPLPSAVLKMGKTVSDPRNIYIKDKENAYRYMAYAICQSYQNIEDDYPILGAFLVKLRELSKHTNNFRSFSKLMEHGDHKVVITSSKAVLRSDVMRSLLLRYETTEDVVEEAEQFIRSVTQIGSIVCHPMFDLLREVDYV